MIENEALKRKLEAADFLLTHWGRRATPVPRSMQSNTADICDFLEMFCFKRKQKKDESKDIRRDLILGLPTEKPRLNLEHLYDQVDFVFSRPDFWVFHIRDREILRRYYIDLSGCNNTQKIARLLSTKSDVIRERKLFKRLNESLIYFLTICGALND